MNRAVLIATVCVVGLVGCAADAPDAAPTTPPPTVTDPGVTVPGVTDPGTATSVPGAFGRARLSFFSDCPDLLQYLRAEASARVTAWGLGGGPYIYGRPADGRAADDSAAGTEAPAATTAGAAEQSPAAGMPSYSGTNTQETGVDEGDIVETNGSHVFVAAQDGVRVVDVAEATVVEQLDVPAGSHQLLLAGDRLLVVTQPYSGVEDTITSLYDVTNPADPTLLRRSHLEGRVVATRAIDGVARLVLTSSIAARLPFVYPQQFGLDEDRALAENRRIVEESAIEHWLPRRFDESADGSFGPMSAALDCAAVAAPREFAGLGISWVASLDLDGDQAPLGAAGVVSSGETVYASPSNIYLATVPWDWYHPVDGGFPGDKQPPTMIHQFALGANGAAAYIASGEVAGTLLNQFSMSEHAGDLRVATTTHAWAGPGISESAVYVLRPHGGELVIVGSVGGLGKDEQIYAVRFLGTLGYVVTFRQVDPLYVLDLADPTRPVVRGELKMPGYSAYLHPVGDGLLLGVGQQADGEGRVQGTKLSLFDVRDPSDPREISSLPIGGSSEAEWDHHAFLFWPEDGTIVIPTSPSWQVCGPAIDCLADQIHESAGGAVVAQLQGDRLVGRGVIEHEYRHDTTCWSPLQRSMIIGTEIVTVGFDQVKFTDRATLVGRGQARWGNPGDDGCGYWTE